MKQIVPETIADQAIAMLSDSKSNPHHAKSAIA
jgi:hypothetical protein